MKKIYLLLVALLVSCLYSTQARAGDVTVGFATTPLASGALPSGTFSNTQTFAFNTTPGIQFTLNYGTYTSSTGKLKFGGTSGLNKTMTISTTDGTKMTKIVFEDYSGSNVSTTRLKCSEGTLTVATPLEWNNASGSNSVTFTLNYGRTNITFSGVTITLAGGNTPNLVADPKEIDMACGYTL